MLADAWHSSPVYRIDVMATANHDSYVMPVSLAAGEHIKPSLRLYSTRDDLLARRFTLVPAVAAEFGMRTGPAPTSGSSVCPSLFHTTSSLTMTTFYGVPIALWIIDDNFTAATAFTLQ